MHLKIKNIKAATENIAEAGWDLPDSYIVYHESIINAGKLIRNKYKWVKLSQYLSQRNVSYC